MIQILTEMSLERSCQDTKVLEEWKCGSIEGNDGAGYVRAIAIISKPKC